MTVRRSGSPRRFARRVVLAGAATWCALGVGCRSSSGSGGDRGGPLGLGVFDRRDDSSGSLASRGDPLLGGKNIPPQNLPVHSKEGLAARGDPLLGSPAGRIGDTPPSEKTDRVGQRKKDTADPGDAALPPRRRDDPYRPGPTSTNAALAAGRLDPSDPKLAIDPDRRPRVTPAAFTQRGDTNGRTYEQIAAELKDKYEALVGAAERDRDGGYVVRAEVPIDPGQPGRLRAYEGTGPTAVAAAKQVLDQVRDDRRK